MVSHGSVLPTFHLGRPVRVQVGSSVHSLPKPGSLLADPCIEWLMGGPQRVTVFMGQRQVLLDQILEAE